MEMITKKLMEEKNGQGQTSSGSNNTEKAGISLDEAKQKTNEDNNCCSFSF